MGLRIKKDETKGRLHIRSNTTANDAAELSIPIAKGADVCLHLNRNAEVIEVEVRGVRFSTTEEAESSDEIEQTDDLSSMGFNVQSIQETPETPTDEHERTPGDAERA